MDSYHLLSFSLLAAFFTIFTFWKQQFLGNITRSDFYLRSALVLLVFLETRLGRLSLNGESLAKGKPSNSECLVLLSCLIFLACILSPTTQRALEEQYAEDGCQKRRNKLPPIVANESRVGESDTGNFHMRWIAKALLSSFPRNILNSVFPNSGIGMHPPSAKSARWNTETGQVLRLFQQATPCAEDWELPNYRVSESALPPETKAPISLAASGTQSTDETEGNNDQPRDSTPDEIWGALETVNNAIRNMFGYGNEGEESRGRAPSPQDEEVFKAQVQIRRRRTTTTDEDETTGDRRLRPKVAMYSSSSSDAAECYPLPPSKIGKTLCPPDPCTQPRYLGRSRGSPTSAFSGRSGKSPKIILENEKQPFGKDENDEKGGIVEENEKGERERTGSAQLALERLHGKDFKPGRPRKRDGFSSCVSWKIFKVLC